MLAIYPRSLMRSITLMQYNMCRILYGKRFNLGFKSIDKKIIKAGIINTHEAANNDYGCYDDFRSFAKPSFPV